MKLPDLQIELSADANAAKLVKAADAAFLNGGFIGFLCLALSPLMFQSESSGTFIQIAKAIIPVLILFTTAIHTFQLKALRQNCGELLQQLRVERFGQGVTVSKQ